MDLVNVFVTVGTTQFDLLVKTITQPDCIRALKNRGCRRLILQIGSGTYVPSSGEFDGVHVTSYRYKDSIKEDMCWANFIISHAGAGSCLEALELEKLLLVVVNTDLMDNHQMEVATKLKEGRYLHSTTCSQLHDVLSSLDASLLRVYPKQNPRIFNNAIDSIMGFR